MLGDGGAARTRVCQPKSGTTQAHSRLPANPVMRKLDVKEIHGYNASLGLTLKPEALGKRKKKKNGSTDL